MPIACPFTSPLGDEAAAAIKLLYAVIIGISYIDVARAVYGDGKGSVELSIAYSFFPKYQRRYPHRVVIRRHDDQQPVIPFRRGVLK